MKKSIVLLLLFSIIIITSCSLFGGGELEISGEWLTNTEAGLYYYTFADTIGFWDVPYTEIGGGMEILSFDNNSRTMTVLFHSHQRNELKGKYAKLSWTEVENDTMVLTTHTPAESAAAAEAIDTVFSVAACDKTPVSSVGSKSNPANMSALFDFSAIRINGVMPKDKLLYISGLTEYALNEHTAELTFQSEDLDIYSYTRF